MRYTKHDCQRAALRFSVAAGRKVGQEPGDLFVDHFYGQGYRLEEAMEHGGARPAITGLVLPAGQFVIMINAAEEALFKYAAARPKP